MAPAAAPTLLTNSRRLVVESLLNMISSMKKMHSLDLLERAAGRVRPVTHTTFHCMMTVQGKEQTHVLT